MGKSKSDLHKRNKTRTSDIPIMVIDYSFLTEEEHLQYMPLLNIVDRHTSFFKCEIVPRKGADQVAATVLRTYIKKTG